MPMVRRLRPFLAAALTVCAVTPFVAARAGAPTGDDLLACDVAGQVKALTDGWVKINSPAYATGEGDPVVDSYAVPAYAPARIYVSNGQVVQTSMNAGCKWDHIYPAKSDTPAVTSRRVAQLVAPTPTALWITSYDSDGVPRPHVEWTPNAGAVAGGATSKPFTAIDRGLPAVGKPVALGVSRVKEDRAFLLVEDVASPLAGDGAARPARTLYRLARDSNLQQVPGPDLSLGWEKAEMGDLPADFGPIDGMTMNTIDMFGVWIWSGSKYAFSYDAGKTFKTFEAPGPVTAIDLNERDAALVTTSVGGRSYGLELSRDEKFQYAVDKAIDLPTVATAVVHGQDADVYAVAGATGTYGFDLRQRKWASIHPKGVSPFVAMQMGKSARGRILLGQAAGALYRFDLYKPEGFLPLPPGFGGSGDYGDLPTGGLNAPILKAKLPEVTVAPGGDVPDLVDLGLNPDPSPLDVFFLMDTTTSMQTSIDALKLGVQHIAQEIARKTHGYACFGLAQFKDEGLATQGGGLTIPYRRELPITCEQQPLPLLTAKLAAMKEGGGNNDEREAATLALHEAVKGDAWTSPVVLPNQAAEFRTGNTKKVIVLITDAAFMPSQGPSKLPTTDEAIKDLNGYGVNVVGIVVHDRNKFIPAKDDVTKVVVGTHTVAPENGVDCDEDGSADLAPGDPLVCEADGGAPKIGPAIVGLLLGVKDMGTVALNVGDPYHVVKKIDGRLSAVRNLKLENHLTPTLHLTCSQEQDGMDLPVRLIGSRRATGVVDSKIIVHCRGPKAPLPPPPPPRIPEPDPIPLPRPQLAPVLLPQFQPPPVNNPISNINPNAGFSQQEEQQLQLAAVGQDAEGQQQEEEEVELAMSAVQRHDAAAAGLVWGCAMFVGLAGAVGVAQRRRTQRATGTAYVRVR